MINRQKVWKEVRAYSTLMLGLIIYAVAVVGFLTPFEVVSGGVTGIGMIIFFLTKIPIGVSYFVINVLLILLGIKILGPKFGIKTVFAVVFMSVLLTIFPNWLPAEGLMPDERALSVVIAGLMNGVGIALALSSGGSTAGTDIIVMIINKYRNISPGRLFLYMDVVIISSGYFVHHDFQAIVFGLIEMGISAYAVDVVLAGTKQTIQVFIFSSKYAEIADHLVHNLHRGVTAIDSEGWYTGKEGKMLVVVARKHEMTEIIRAVKMLDSHAFLTMNTVMGAYGEGFDTLRA